jgi:integrase
MTDAPKRSRKAGNGDDSIYWDKSKNRFVGAVSLGYTSAGKRNRLKVSGKTKTEVRSKLRELKREREAGVKSSATYTVEQAVRAWLAQGLKGRDVATLETYTSLADCHIVPHLGKAKLRELEADELDTWLEAKTEVLSTQSLRMVHSVLRRSIAHAQRRNKVLRNVAELVEVPDGRPGRPSKSFSLEQATAVLRAKEGSWIHVYVVLSLLVGIRTEEARPLTWQQVHFEVAGAAGPHVDVWRSVRRDGETKTRKSRRSLAMPRQAAAALAAYKRQQQREHKAAGLEWTETGLVFPHEDGGLRTARNVRRNFRTLLAEAGAQAGFEITPDEWTSRELRTTLVSLLSAHGVPIEVIARVVGHSGTVTTERVYRKEILPAITGGAEAMDDIFPLPRAARQDKPEEPA